MNAALDYSKFNSFSPRSHNISHNTISKSVMIYADHILRTNKQTYLEKNGNLRGFWGDCLREAWRMVKNMIRVGRDGFVNAINNRDRFMVYTGEAKNKTFVFSFDEYKDHAIRELRDLSEKGYNAAYIEDNSDLSATTTVKNKLRDLGAKVQKKLSLKRTTTHTEQQKEESQLTTKPVIVKHNKLAFKRENCTPEMQMIINDLARIHFSVKGKDINPHNKNVLLDAIQDVRYKYKGTNEIKKLDQVLTVMAYTIETNDRIYVLRGEFLNFRAELKDFITSELDKLGNKGDVLRDQCTKEINKASLSLLNF